MRGKSNLFYFFLFLRKIRIQTSIICLEFIFIKLHAGSFGAVISRPHAKQQFDKALTPWELKQGNFFFATL
jgi:hypothetical protein